MRSSFVLGITCIGYVCLGSNIVIQNLNEESSSGAPYYLVEGDVDSSIDTGYSFNINGDDISFKYAKNAAGDTNNVMPSKVNNLARKNMIIQKIKVKASVGFELDDDNKYDVLPTDDSFIAFGCALPWVANRDYDLYKLTNGVVGVVWYTKRITELNGNPTNLVMSTPIHDLNGNEINLIYGSNYIFNVILQFPDDQLEMPKAQVIIIAEEGWTNTTEWVECLHHDRNYLVGFDVNGAKEFYYKDQGTSKSVIGTEVGNTKVLDAKIKMVVSREDNNVNFAVTPIGKDVCKNNPFKIQCKINGKWTTLTTINANKTNTYTPVDGKGIITYLGKVKIAANKFEDIVVNRQYRLIDELNYVYSSLVVIDNL